MPDDFKRIKGITQTANRRLHAANIHTYEQLAALSPHEVAQLLAGSGISVERIAIQDWVGAAQSLTSAMAPSGRAANQRDVREHDARQHYAVYKVRLLLNEDNEVRYTEVQNVNQLDDRNTWPGWDDLALTQFLAASAKIKLPAQRMTADVSYTSAPVITPVDSNTEEKTSVPAEPLAIEICDIAVDEVATNPSINASVASKLRAKVAFEMSGATAKSIVVMESPFVVSVTIREEFSPSLISLNAGNGRLDPNDQRYYTQVDFDMPPAGRYQMIGRVQLQNGSLCATKVGPWFRVTA